MRKQYSPTFKANVVLELLREDKTLNEAAAAHSVHVNQLRRWRQQAITELVNYWKDKWALPRKELLQAKLDQLQL